MAAGYGGRGQMMVAPQGASPAPQQMQSQMQGNWYQHPWWQQGTPANAQYQALFNGQPQGATMQSMPPPQNAGTQMSLPPSQPATGAQMPPHMAGVGNLQPMINAHMLSRALA